MAMMDGDERQRRPPCRLNGSNYPKSAYRIASKPFVL